MQRDIEIHWNGFPEQCCKNYPDESCAFLFAKKPFSLNEEWFIFPVANVSDDKKRYWEPDKNQLRDVKLRAITMKFTLIGNIHSHPVDRNEIKAFDSFENYIEHLKKPSLGDLQYARRFNNVVRGILVVDDKRVLAHLFHDQFGEPIDIYLEGINKRLIMME